MRNHFIVALAAFACFISFLYVTADVAKATSLDQSPFMGVPITIGPNDPTNAGLWDVAHLGVLALIDPADAAQLVKVYAACAIPGNPGLYGITAGTMFCLKEFIIVATHIYATGLNNANGNYIPLTTIPLNWFILFYQTTCLVAAMAIFGARTMTMQTRHFGKELFNFIIRIGVAFFLITQASFIFDTLLGFIAEGMVWLGNVLNLVQLNDACWTLNIPLVGAKSMLTTVGPLIDPNFRFDEYKIWNMIDCTFMHIFGASQAPLNFTLFGTNYNTTGLIGENKLIYASAIPIIAGAFFSSTLGVSAAVIALSGIVSCVLFVMRAMFMVLSSYLTLAFMCLLTPFFAPLLFFESHTELKGSYTGKVFNRWIGIIVSTIIQPVVILGYLSFGAVLLDAFIQGDSSPNGDIKALFANCGSIDLPGDGLCSFDQLFTPVTKIGDTLAGVPIPAGTFDWMMNSNPVIGHMKIIGDPQLTSNNCTMIDRTTSFIHQTANDLMNQVDSKASGVTIHGPEQLKTTPIRLMKFSMTFVCFMIVAITLSQLMETITALATQFGEATMSNLWATASVPFEGLVRSAIEGAQKGASGAGGKGLFAGGGLDGIMGLPAATKSSIKGAVSQMGSYLTGSRD